MSNALPELGDKLAPFEIRALQAAADYGQNDMIAKALGWSRCTVANALSSVYLKLGAHDGRNAIAIGFRRGLIR